MPRICLDLSQCLHNEVADADASSCGCTTCIDLSQGFKVVIRDIGLHMSNRVMDYCSEDASLCRGALEAQKGPRVSLTKTDFASVQEYLESSHFVQAST